jgi:hypothetical protein
MRTRGRGFWFIGLLVVVLSVTGCGGQSTTPPAPAPPTSGAPPLTTAPATPASVAGAAALASYRGMWKAFVEAGRTSDWQSATLGRYATGVALTNLTRGLYADSLNKLITKGEPVLSPAVASVEPNDDPLQVLVSDCADSTNWLKYRSSDGSLADTPGGRRLINAVVERQADKSWKVSDFGVQKVGTC